MFKIVFTSMLITVMQCNANLKCPTSSNVPKYHLIEKCHRSKLGIAAKAKFSSLTSCKRLAIEKKALALNFNPNWNSSEHEEYSCEVLKCAEAKGGLSLSNDTRYDYYSIYAHPIPDINTTCVPATGMFYLLSNNLNQSQAQNECRNMSGTLADVSSEQRTDALAQALSSAGATDAYVGLKKENGTRFHSIDGNSLDCSTYRAWAPGHPRRNSHYKCVVLTKHHTWRTTNCRNTYPALCELIPNGPYKKSSIFI